MLTPHKNSTTFAIEETTYFESLLNISVDEEILPGASETLHNTATQPNPCPPIIFEFAESEIEALYDLCAAPRRMEPKSNYSRDYDQSF